MIRYRRIYNNRYALLMETKDTNSGFKDNVVRAVALIGLLLVLLLGAWGIVLLAFNLPTIAGTVGNSIVGLFNPANTTGGVPALSVSAPASATSGSAFTLSWNKTSSDSDTYTISYSCQNGLAIKAPTPAGSYQSAPVFDAF